METSAISSVAYAAAPVASGRASNAPVRAAAESDAVFQQASASTAAPGQEAQQATLKRLSEEKETAKAAASQEPSSVGRIRFELDDGTRIAKFFDTKDVLIYQVPPEGSVYLVRIQETSSQDVVETSA